MKHTKEPWMCKQFLGRLWVRTEDEEIAQVNLTYYGLDNKAQANAQRIVACVNACADITEEDLPIVIKYGREQLSRMQKLKSKKRCDETLDRNLDVIFGNKSTGTSTPVYYCPFCHRKLEDV